MYKGKNKTAMASRKRIADAFVKLLQKTPYASISISSICREAGISRQTFYSLFTTKEKIIIYLLGRDTKIDPELYFHDIKLENNERANRRDDKAGSIQNAATSRMTIDYLSSHYSRFLKEHKDFLTLVVKNDLIFLLQNGMQAFFLATDSFLPELSGVRRELAATFVSGGLAGVAKCYASDDEMNEEELATFIAGLLRGTYYSQNAEGSKNNER